MYKKEVRPPMNKDEREAFEKTYFAIYCDSALNDPEDFFEKDKSGEYVDRDIDFAWQGWQARSSIDAEFAADAERYRFIRGDGYYVVPDGQYIPSVHGEALDILIDAALATHKGKG